MKWYFEKSDEFKIIPEIIVDNGKNYAMFWLGLFVCVEFKKEDS